MARGDSSELDGSRAQQAWATVLGWYDRLTVWGNRQPWLTLRRVLWLVGGGFWLFVLYLFAGLALCSTLVFIPFGIQTWRVGLFALDGGITLQPSARQVVVSFDSSPWDNPAHPFTIAANVFYAVLFGWAMALAHLAAALVQALTIVGLGTAVTNVQMATFVVWPFGRSIVRRPLPTTLEELYETRAQSEAGGWTRWV